MKIQDIYTAMYREKKYWHIMVYMGIWSDYYWFEMSQPMSKNGVNQQLDWYDEDDDEELSLDELMKPEMLEYRNAIKLRQEALVETYNIWRKWTR